MVLSLSGLDQIIRISPGSVVAGAGAVLADIDNATRAHSGQELRMFPSTHRIASIGGFVAGGSGGIGSIHWGGLRDLGNIIRIRIVTAEASPRILTLEGDQVAKVAHAYGTNGVITEVEAPLAPAYNWVDMVVGFDTFDAAVAFADELSRHDGLLLKELSVMAAPIAHSYFPHHGKYVRSDQSTVLIMVALHTLNALDSFIRRRHGETMFRSDKINHDELHDTPPLFECTWNHTTLYAHRINPIITYLQVLYPYPHYIERVTRMRNILGDEMMEHLEFLRFDGRVACLAIPLIKFTTDERLGEIITMYEDNGCIVFNPHRCTLEEGGMKRSDLGQLSFKREVDPKGLLNPGKMIAWDNPNFDFSSNRNYLFPGTND